MGIEIAVIICYTLVLFILGYIGKLQTKSVKDYDLAKSNFIIVTLSYGATIMSTSAIVGFGGITAWLGTSMWLHIIPALLCSIFIPFYFLGAPTNELAKKLNAKTYGELLGKRYDSNFIRTMVGIIIMLFMPLYTAAVMVGCAEVLKAYYDINYFMALSIIAIITLAYVVYGGLKSVLLTDTFQAVLIIVVMAAFGWFSYEAINPSNGFDKLSTIWTTVTSVDFDKGNSQMLNVAKKMGFVGWDSMPVFLSEGWLFVVTTLVVGIGVGMLGQPQLIVRLMAAKNSSDLKKGIIPGMFFIVISACLIYIIGPFTNIWYFEHYGMSAIQYVGTPDKIIPNFITLALPNWLSFSFLICLLAAGMSTLSGLYHTMGTALINDVAKHNDSSIMLTKLSVAMMGIVSLLIALTISGKSIIIAKSTIIFFTLCANMFLPMYIFGLLLKKANKIAAIASMIVGLVGTVFWMLFVHKSEAVGIGVCKLIFGKDYLFNNSLAYIDSIITIFPASVLTYLIVYKLTCKKYN